MNDNINSIVLFLFGNIQLRMIEAIIIGLTTLGFIGLILMMYIRHKIVKNAYSQIETNGANILTISNKGMTKLNKQFDLIRISTAIIFILSISMIMIYSNYNSLALKYGAYGNGQKLQTINEIYDCTILRGFVDQSETLPDNIRGKLIIFYKYGCPDCREIHNEIITCLQENDVINETYFVSTRSEIGAELIKTYPVKEVPTGIYIREKDSEVSNMYTEILYGHIYDEENNKVVFFEKDKMLSLIEHLKNGD